MKKKYSNLEYEVEKFTIVGNICTTSQGIPDTPLDDENSNDNATIY